jgi:hypothetical protein
VVKIIGTTSEVDDFVLRLICPIEDNIGTLEICPFNDDASKANCDKCVIDTYNLKLVYED